MRLTTVALTLGTTLLPTINAQDNDSHGLIDLDIALELAGLDVSAAIDILCFPTYTVTPPPGGTSTATITETETFCPVSKVIR
jgi:hypothetical protein